jgi:hypothetical protein
MSRAVIASAALLACLLAARGAAQIDPRPATPLHDLGWEAARWGMTVEEVLAAFPGVARRIEPEEVLADGNVVAAGIDLRRIAGVGFRVRFVFSPARRLVLVSLRTPETEYAKPEDYAKVCAALAAQHGWPGEEARDDNFIDLRQTRWKLGRTAVDAKHIPGVVAAVWFPWPPPSPQTGEEPADGAGRR